MRNCDPKRIKEISKVIGKYAPAQSTASEELAVSMMKGAERKAIGKAIEAAKEAKDFTFIYKL